MSGCHKCNKRENLFLDCLIDIDDEDDKFFDIDTFLGIDLNGEEFESLKKMVEDLAGRLEAEDEDEEMEEEKEELSADPSLIKHNPEAKKEVELTKIGKVSGTRNRVFNKIFNQ